MRAVTCAGPSTSGKTTVLKRVARKLYSGDLRPDHCSVLVLGDAVAWAAAQGAALLLMETAGLCPRCAPYVEGALGIVVLEATSGMNLPRKIGAMRSLADLALPTKTDLVSQAEREVFRADVADAAPVPLIEADALRGIEIGHYNRVACEGVVRHTRQPLQIGRRYFFLPRHCMLQSRHSGVVNVVAQRADGARVRIEGIAIA